MVMPPTRAAREAVLSAQQVIIARGEARVSAGTPSTHLILYTHIIDSFFQEPGCAAAERAMISPCLVALLA
jgi:hypothetical protein